MAWVQLHSAPARRMRLYKMVATWQRVDVLPFVLGELLAATATTTAATGSPQHHHRHHAHHPPSTPPAYGFLHLRSLSVTDSGGGAVEIPLDLLIALPLVLVAHVFTFLLTHWSVGFRCFVGYRGVTNPLEATVARMVPSPCLDTIALIVRTFDCESREI